MENIGIKLKEKREENGVSVEEAAEDLKIRPNQIKALEEGKKEEFKDVLYLKEFIKDYAKYLGLDADLLVDEFNEYLFDYTSKIPVDIIEKAKSAKQEEKKTFTSPYTTNKTNKSSKVKNIVLVIIIIILVFLSYFFINKLLNKNMTESNITYIIGR